jgi:hypothetical protein
MSDVADTEEWAREIAERAWDEGFDNGVCHADDGWEAPPEIVVNPYRKAPHE